MLQTYKKLFAKVFRKRYKCYQKFVSDKLSNLQNYQKVNQINMFCIKILKKFKICIKCSK